MNYSSFTINILLRIFFIALCIFALVLMIQQKTLIVSSLALGALLIFQIWQLIFYIHKIQRDINYFFESILTEDFISRISPKRATPIEREIYGKFTLIQQKFQKLRHSNEELIRYYSLVLEKVPIAILIVDGEKLTLANSAAQKLFQRNALENIQSLHPFGLQFAQDVQHIQPGEQRTSQIILHRETSSLSLSAASIQLAGSAKKIISISPIQLELDKQEIIAWQNLVQVFSHEIMNSMTPLTSLSKTAADLLASLEPQTATESREIVADAQQAIDVVARRADHLMGFVQAYRRIANPPKIQPSLVQVEQLFRDSYQLFSEQIQSRKIQLHWQVTPNNLTLNADPIQIEQALINLLKNSLEALANTPSGEIFLSAYIGTSGKLVIEVTDNGCGIAMDKLEHIFVPFYTSKREGTGIGLFLVKQIMQAHLGSVHATSNVNGGASFRLSF